MSIRDSIIAYADDNLSTYKQIALDIHAHPEVSNYEFYACERLSGQLATEGFDVKVDVAGHRTGFAAYYKSHKPGPVIVFLAEYDALAGLGHGCGHNIFGATSALAGAALKHVIEEVGGEARVYGTPGEEGGENGSAKGSFVREGFLDDVDAALCVHPGSDKHGLTGKSLACAPVDIEFWGKAAHACAAWNGANALDALLQVYNSISFLRQQLTPDIRIHGIIVKGGDAPNTVPTTPTRNSTCAPPPCRIWTICTKRWSTSSKAQRWPPARRDACSPIRTAWRTPSLPPPLTRCTRRIWSRWARSCPIPIRTIRAAAPPTWAMCRRWFPPFSPTSVSPTPRSAATARKWSPHPAPKRD